MSGTIRGPDGASSLFASAGTERWRAWGLPRVTTGFAILLLLHGLIHLLGASKAFGWAELPHLTQPISPARGMLWLASALLFAGTAASLFAWSRGWRGPMPRDTRA